MLEREVAALAVTTVAVGKLVGLIVIVCVELWQPEDESADVEEALWLGELELEKTALALAALDTLEEALGLFTPDDDSTEL